MLEIVEEIADESAAEEVSKRVHAAFEREPRINPHQYPIRLEFNADQVLTLEGEVRDIAAKKLALELAATTLGVRGLVDRLRVKPAVVMTDGEIREHVRDAFLGEPALQNCAIRAQAKGQLETFREAVAEPAGEIQIIVDNEGAVLLEGRVPSLSHKRLAGVLAWWVPGSTNVLNCLEVIPPEEDSDEEITDAVRLTLEKDPFVNADPIGVRTQNRVVTLDGVAPNEKQKEMAEYDAWYVFGVDKVINRLEITAK